MITAIPMNDDRVASHFTKAECLVFLDDQGREMSRVTNPARGANCSGKQKMVDLLAEKQVERVIVRNIGEQMLGKLLARQFSVYQTHCGRKAANELVNAAATGLLRLEQASQGRQSLNHEEKRKAGGCGCDHHGAHEAGAQCCSTQPHHQDGANCRHGAEGRGQGRGRCCNS